MAKHKSSYYDGGVRVVKDGVPCRLASWVKELTPEGQRLIGQNRIYSALYGRNISFK